MNILKHTICYVSKVAEGLDTESLDLIFLSTQQNNIRKGITGVLLHGMGNFFQVLEGPKKVLETLYDVIKEDPRHTEVFEIMNKPAEEYIFNEYSSFFKVVKTSEELDQVKTYLKQNNINSRSEKLNRLLKPFIILDL